MAELNIKCLLPIFILLLGTTSFGQKSVAELKPAHAVALETYLSKNKNLQFLSEKVIDAEYLSWIRKDFDKELKPYYRVADFNHDKIEDFAMILSRKGEPKKQNGVTSKEHKYEYPLQIVIFNGNKSKSFTKAFSEDIYAPLVCFLNTSYDKKRTLYFGVFATDSAMIFTPVGKGYIIEYPDNP